MVRETWKTKQETKQLRAEHTTTYKHPMYQIITGKAAEQNQSINGDSNQTKTGRVHERASVLTRMQPYPKHP